MDQTTASPVLQSVFQAASTRLNAQILGQESLIERLLIALLSDGHLLVEGAPGLAKTRAVKALATLLEGDFHRVQFTPDLLPADLTGTDIYQPEKAAFSFQKGPLFHNLILADEINRAPAKVQSALLEAMAERQITIGKTTHSLPQLFLVMATQNPIEQEGTYPLPEAQLDRFLLHVTVDYPTADIEKSILALARHEARVELNGAAHDSTADLSLQPEQIRQARQAILNIHLSDPVEQYIIHLVMSTRTPGKYSETLAQWIEYGASPRGSIGLERVSRAHAWLYGRDYVSPDDVQQVIHDVLRHRIILSFAAEAEGITRDAVIDRLIELIPVP